MATTHNHNRVIGSYGVEVVTQRQSLLYELPLMPITVGQDDATGFGITDTIGDFQEHLPKRPRLRKVYPVPTTDTVKVVVSKTWNDAAATQVDLLSFGATEQQDFGIATDRHDTTTAYSNCFGHR